MSHGPTPNSGYSECKSKDCDCITSHDYCMFCQQELARAIEKELLNQKKVKGLHR